MSSPLIAIVGGTGLLGRHLQSELSRHGLDMIVLSRNRPETTNSDWLRLPDDPADLTRTFSACDAVVNLAAQRSPMGGVEPQLANTLLVSKVLDAAADAGVRAFVNASSISVYGTGGSLPWPESVKPHPNSYYGIMKLAGEFLVERRAVDFDACVNLRLAHLFGEGEHNNYMINRFMRLAYNKLPLPLNAPAIAERDFLYAGEAARAIRLSLAQRRVRGTLNIGSGVGLTNLDVAMAVNEGFRSRAGTVMADSTATEGIKSSVMNVARAASEIDFVSRISMLEAMSAISEGMRRRGGDVPIDY
ncbi:NAD-dependent epimerase/dehydratase family protein [Agromyces italicus]|uniref:NAD-dependent epimerase/dehydratase family protein n=1 Tax=Agromyces italicus TaxID=279572 RepID=UPI0003B743E8|nr:SDR family oxidoreductase [Agromyces italicus]